MQSKTTFLLDTNIVIRIWKDNPKLLSKIDLSDEFVFLISNETLAELANGELENFIPAPNANFHLLLNHVRDNDVYSGDPKWKENRYLYEQDGAVYYRVESKVSSVDYGLVSMCQNYDLILVTEDKKLLRSARTVIESDRVLDYTQFLRAIGSMANS